jgi:GT2 family glycosyltransferase
VVDRKLPIGDCFGYWLAFPRGCSVSASFSAPTGFRLASTEEIRDGQGMPVRVVHPDPGLRVTLVPERPVPSDWYQLELVFPPEGLVDVTARFLFAGGNVLWLRLPVFARNHFLAHFRLEEALEELTLVVTGSGRLDAAQTCRFERVGLGGQLSAAARRGIEIMRRDGLRVVASGVNYLWRLTRPGSIAFSRGSAAANGEMPYDAWMRLFDEHPERDRARHTERLATMSHQPLISLLAHVPASDGDSVARLAQSASDQIYPGWELVVAAPVERHQEIAAALSERGVDGAKLRMVAADGGEAESFNAVLAAAQGEFVLPLWAGTTLRPHAMLDLALTMAHVPGAELIYADEDRIDAEGNRSDWRFKPAFSPDLLDAIDYIGSPALIRRETARQISGWRDVSGHRHELLRRLAASVLEPSIVHLARLLAHTTGAAGQPIAAPPAVPTVPNPPPRVSLIIPTRDGADVLETCVRSIRKLTRYDNYEIIIVDNGSVEERTKALFVQLARDPDIRILPRAEPFNFSRLNNAAAREATGTIIGLINNDIEVTDGAWLSNMVALAVRPETGCVGAKLLYPDGRLQHAGVVVGLGGVAGHGHRFQRADEPGYLGRLHHVHEASAVTAACLLVRRDVFDAVNGFDEGLTVAFNDVDFCLRVRAAGYRNVWTPRASLIHHESVSRGRDLTPSKARRFAGEYATMHRRWAADMLADPYYSPHLTYDLEDFSLRLR